MVVIIIQADIPKELWQYGISCSGPCPRHHVPATWWFWPELFVSFQLPSTDEEERMEVEDLGEDA